MPLGIFRSLCFASALALFSLYTQASCPAVRSEGLACDTYASPPKGSTWSDGQLRVNYFFMYTCPHCGPLEKFTRKWQDKQNFAVGMYHVSWRGNEFARTHYALVEHGLAKSLNQRLFEAIRSKTYRGPDDLVQWATADGSDRAGRLKAAIESKEAYENAEVAEAMAYFSKLDRIPTFTISGKYRVSVGKADPATLAELESLLDTLVAQVRLGR